MNHAKTKHTSWISIDKHELASALAQLLRELPGDACWGTDLRLLRVSLAEYNENAAEPAQEEVVAESHNKSVEKNPDSDEEVDQTEELELLQLLASAHSWLGCEPAPKFSKIGSTYPYNNDEINRYHAIRIAIDRCYAYISKGM